MKSLEEALAHMLDGVVPLDGEDVALGVCAGRALASPLKARFDHPPFDQSAMDGYAVQYEALARANAEAPVTLPLVGESRAGGSPPPRCNSGEAVRVFTGAAIPEGADAVVVQEDTFVHDSDSASASGPSSEMAKTVGFRFAPPPGHHFRRQGSSCAAGTTIAIAGERVDAAIIGAAASEGLTTLQVRRRPRVYLMATGDELVQPGTPLRPGAIYDSNGPMLQALVEAHGGEPVQLAPMADSLEAMKHSLQVGLDGDMLITSGGVSVGDYDVVRDALTAVGVDLSLWKVAIKPGKPIAFGTKGATRVLGLPGNPVSAFVTFHLFVRPLLERLQGARAAEPLRVRLGQDTRHSLGRTEFVRGRIEQRGAELFVVPNLNQSSGALHDLAQSEVLVRLPGDREHFEEGTILEAIPLRPVRGTNVPKVTFPG